MIFGIGRGFEKKVRLALSLEPFVYFDKKFAYALQLTYSRQRNCQI